MINKIFDVMKANLYCFELHNHKVAHWNIEVEILLKHKKLKYSYQDSKKNT